MGMDVGDTFEAETAGSRTLWGDADSNCAHEIRLLRDQSFHVVENETAAGAFVAAVEEEGERFRCVISSLNLLEVNGERGGGIKSLSALDHRDRIVHSTAVIWWQSSSGSMEVSHLRMVGCHLHSQVFSSSGRVDDG